MEEDPSCQITVIDSLCASLGEGLFCTSGGEAHGGGYGVRGAGKMAGRP